MSWNRLPLAAIAAAWLVVICGGAHAQTRPSVCVDIKTPKAVIESQGGKWITLSAPQWQFLRGVFSVNPETPPGLPFGDHAVLATIKGHDGGLVFFIDGKRACTPMAAPKELVEMLGDVGANIVSHEGGKL